jgi:hypothetical protein
VRHEFVGHGPVDQAVVAQRQIPHRPDRDRVVDYDWTLLDLPIPRIATCGWLMIGIPNSAPKTPGS